MKTEIGKETLILSPNLGCPQIVSIEDKDIISIIVAVSGEDSECVKNEYFEGRIAIQPSFPEPGGNSNKAAHLIFTEEPLEITGWNQLSSVNSVDDTRKIFNSELHNNVLGESTRYWELKAKINPENGNPQNELYDLIFYDNCKKSYRTNYHALHFVDTLKKDVNFLHLTDLHLAKRNDEIPNNIKFNFKGTPKNEDLKYNNFNNNFIEFVKAANKLKKDEGLDFIVITGDIIDYVNYGWDDKVNPVENNWKIFENIVLGRVECCEGLKVPIFTSTGNHDWRLHPYDIAGGKMGAVYGLEENIAKHYKYKDLSPADLKAEKKKAYEAIKSGILKKTKTALKKGDKFKLSMATWLTTKWKFCLPLVFGGGSGIVQKFTGFQFADDGITKIISSLIILVLLVGFQFAVKRVLDKYIILLVDNPLHAEVNALHYYLKNINPYFDYTASYGNNHIVIMDTGTDCFTGQLLDGKTIGNLMKLSLEDNILGGSPDSIGFDSRQTYYKWSQIAWLEKVLELIGVDKQTKSNIIICLHASPINPPDKDTWESLIETYGNGKDAIPKHKVNLTYGTINHYLSQFFHFCLGKKEINFDGTNNLKKIDLVLSGHSHKNIEFRIDDKNNNINFYTQEYSKLLKAESAKNGDINKWWDEMKPIITQTGPCGPLGHGDEIKVPYYRKIKIDDKGLINSFEICKTEKKTSL